ncbi:MAG: 3-methyl-2-oxobutanoate dehydrogenase subunit VorB [Verrucomicrobiota bacterium]|nr:3-methyl-2-oxobutanoate dehydrogenase subunit VorB [Verrucomicrobiota bacterium]
MVTKLVKGNTAVAVGAVYAGAECFFGYPITPASEILHEASHLFPDLGRAFIQAESEEAAINMVFGASAAGRRVITASSGPGMSLMQEGVSYLSGAELPCVMVDVMRAGPGLGNIGPEQGDYHQVVKGGGHGNYRTIVLAPNSVQEMCDLTMLAFDLAERYRTPVVVLADGVLGQMIEPLRFPEHAVEPEMDPSWCVAGIPETRSNLVASIFLDFDQQEAFNWRLQRKYAEIESVEQRVECHRVEDADLVLVIKSFDFLVYSDTGPNLIIDVKGRQFPDMIPGRAKRGLKTWENWITREDVDGLGEWWGVFGPGFWPVLVFAYWLRGDPTHSPFEDVHFFKNRCYAFTAVGLEQYVHAAKHRSMKWRTIAVPSGQFSNLVKQVSHFM